MAATKRTVTHNPGAFLDLPPEASSYEQARVVVLPLPLEESVSYGGGAAHGPAAIITASQQVELYDPILDNEPALDYGVHTLPVPGYFTQKAKRRNIGELLGSIGETVANHMQAGKFVVGLGGEHTVSYGMAQGVAKTAGRFSVVHIDAHADLRDTYEDDPYSHACVLRRIAEMPECNKVLQLGIRSTSPDQVAYARQRGIKTWYAWDIHNQTAWKNQLKRAVKNEPVFFTFDVDGLDPAIVPATGTPEPNGLTWTELMEIVAITTENARSILALDCVELAPVANLHYADFAVARALYAILTQCLR